MGDGAGPEVECRHIYEGIGARNAYFKEFNGFVVAEVTPVA